jgi:hypothetical protein
LGGLYLFSYLLFDTIGGEDLVENILELKGGDSVAFNAANDLINDFLVLDVGFNNSAGSVDRKKAKVLFGLFLTVHHVDNSFLEHVVFDTEVLFNLILISKESQVTDLRDLLFSESERVVGNIESFEPFHNWNLIHSLIIFQEHFVVQDSLFSTFSVLQEVTLELSHRKFEFRESLGEVVSLFLLLWVESQEESNHLRVTSVAKISMEISSTWSHKSWIKLFSMVSGHEQDSSLLRSNSIKGVEEARE